MSDITRDYSFGGWLKSIRIRREMTLRQAAKHHGVDCGNWSKMERGVLDPPKSERKIRLLAFGLGATDVETDILVSTAFQHHLANLKRDFSK